MSSEWIEAILSADQRGPRRWLQAVVDQLRPPQRERIQQLLTEQSREARSRVWTTLEKLGGADPTAHYVHDVLRVHSYLGKSFAESNPKLHTLVQFHASFGRPGDRGSLEELLTSTAHLSTLADLFHQVMAEKQDVLLNVASDDREAFDHFLSYIEGTSTSDHSILFSLLADLGMDNFELWVELLVVAPSPQRIGLCRALAAFHKSNGLQRLAKLFFAQKPQEHLKLVDHLVGLAETNALGSIDALLSQLSTSSSTTLLTAIPSGVLTSLEAVGRHPVHHNSILESVITLLSKENLSLDGADAVLRFAALQSDPNAFLTLILDVAAGAPGDIALLFTLFASLSDNEKAQLCRYLRLSSAETDNQTRVSIASVLVHFSRPHFDTLMATTASFAQSEICQLDAFLVALSPDCIEPFLALLSMPAALRQLLYKVLDELETPSLVLQTLHEILLQSRDQLHTVLPHLVKYDAEHKRSLCMNVFQPRIELNRRLVSFLLAPPSDMDALSCLGLLMHAPPSSYDGILSLFQNPRRSSLELLVLHNLLLDIDSPKTIQSCVNALVAFDGDHVGQFFVYLEHVTPADSMVLVDLIETHRQSDIYLYLELAAGLSQSIIRELNAFMTRLDELGRTAWLKLIPNPRRNVLFRLMLSVHSLDVATVTSILQVLESHSWDYRSLLVEQIRVLDDATALDKLLQVHQSLATHPDARYGIETYTMLASYCSKVTQIHLVSVFHRLAVTDRNRFCHVVRSGAPWQPTEAISPGFWTEDNVGRLCALLLQHNAQVAAQLVRVLHELDPASHEDFLRSCANLSSDLAYLTFLLSSASGEIVRALSPVVFSVELTSRDLARLTRCLRKMLKCYTLDVAVDLLLSMPQLPSFLAFFHNVATPTLFVRVLAQYMAHTASLVEFLRALDLDDVTWVLHRLQNLEVDRKARFEALLQRPRVHWTGSEKALCLSVLEGSWLQPRPATASKTIVTSRHQAEVPSQEEEAPCDWSALDKRSLSRKAKRVQDFNVVQTCATTSVEKEFYKLALPPNGAFRLTLISPMESPPTAEPPPSPPMELGGDDNNTREKSIDVDAYPPEVPATNSESLRTAAEDYDEEYSPSDDDDSLPSPPLRFHKQFDHVLIDSYKNLLKPLHTLEEEDLDADGLPRIKIPPPKPISSKSMRGLMPAIQKSKLSTEKRRPSTSPASSFVNIGSDSDLMCWPPSRIRVAKTAQAKQKVFDARLRQSMGTSMPRLVALPSLAPGRSKSCTSL
ncbi:hypothetical protein AC1031_001935 [Aphanomyces cochlioides]|nr:hypothetical protein AC1031_001935 [Aphanomyces cochlioides]